MAGVGNESARIPGLPELLVSFQNYRSFTFSVEVLPNINIWRLAPNIDIWKDFNYIVVGSGGS